MELGKRCLKAMHVVVLLGFLTIGACNDPTPVAPTTEISPSTSRVAAVRGTLDEEWAALARGAIPGFAGYYLDDFGTPVVLVKRGAAREAAREFVRGRRADFGLGFRDVETREVSYDFSELSDWRAALMDRLPMETH